MTDDTGDSDPLPFVQVHRSVKPRAALLAQVMNVSVQHALGSLVEFWDLNSDPRALELLVQKNDKRVLLDEKAVRLKFKIASGQEVDPAVLESLGILQRVDGQYRVRGMSRQLQTIERRLQSKRAGALGGKISSARKTRAETGGAQATAQATAQASRDQEERGDSQESIGQSSKKKIDRSIASISSSKPAEQPAETLVTTKVWSELDEKRVAWCRSRDADPGTTGRRKDEWIAARIESTLDAADIEQKDPDYVISLFDWYCLDNFGATRSPPWALELFFSPEGGVLKNCERRMLEAEGMDEAEAKLSALPWRNA